MQPQFITNTYHEFIRRVSPQEQGRLEMAMELCDQAEIPRLLAAVKQGNFDAPAVNSPILAIRCFREQSLSLEDTAFLLLWNSTKEAHGSKAVTFDTLSSTGLMHINETLPYLKISTTMTTLDEKQRQEWQERMTQEPRLQQRFILVPRGNETELAPHIRLKTGINIFGIVGKKQMVASPAMWRHFMEIKFGDNALGANYCLGLSSAQDIADSQKKGVRDIALPCPFVNLPKRTHGRWARGWQFTSHDNYHRYIASAVLHRDIFLAIGDLFSNSQAGKALQGAAFDMEFSDYRPIVTRYGRKNYRATPATRFWHSIAALPYQAGLLDGPRPSQEAIRTEWKATAPRIASLIRQSNLLVRHRDMLRVFQGLKDEGAKYRYFLITIYKELKRPQ